MHVEHLGVERMTGSIPGVPAQLPNFTADSIFDVDFRSLADLGIEHVLLDVDGTTRWNWDKHIRSDVAAHIAQVRREVGSLAFCLATNNKGDIVRERFAVELGDIPVYQPFKVNGEMVRKPDVRFFQRILQTEGIENPRTAVMIGDKPLCDIAGASDADINSVLVELFGPDFWFDMIRCIRTRNNQALEEARRIASTILLPPEWGAVGADLEAAE